MEYVESWQPVADTVSRQIRAARERQSLSLAQLSQRLSDIGYPLSIKLLSRIERGERNITVNDVSALGQALFVPVSDLLMRGDPREQRDEVKRRQAFYWELRRLDALQTELATMEKDLEQMRSDVALLQDHIRAELESDLTLSEVIDKFAEELKNMVFEGEDEESS